MTETAIKSPAGGGAATRPGHPAPQRTNVSPLALWFGLFGGAFAWSVQLLVNYAVAAHVCYPRAVPLTLPTIGESAMLWTLVIVSIATVVIGAAALVVAIRTWRRTSRETGGGSHWLLDTGEGRTRFMAAAAIMTSSIFLLAIIVHLAAVLALRYCS